MISQLKLLRKKKRLIFFPNVLKQAVITPIYKKDNPFDKTNYRTISILPILSKVYEWCLYDQIYDHFDSILSKIHMLQHGHNSL